jgi:hypothetical protein
MKLFLSLLLFLAGSTVLAQLSSVSVTSGYGRNLHHKNKINLYNFSLSLLENKDGNKDWQVFYGRPKIGYVFSYSHYFSGNESTSACSLYPAIIFKGNTKLSYEFLVGAGLSYYNDVNVSFISDYRYLSSRLDWLFVFSGNIVYHLNRFNLFAGFNVSHNSNASVKLPNHGMNTVAGFAGVEYRFREGGQEEKAKTKKELLFKKYPFNIEFEFGVGPKYLLYNTTNFLFEKNAAIFSGAVYLSRRFKFFKPRLGLRLTDYKSHSREYHDHVNYIVMGGNDFIFGRLSILFNVGYLVQKNNALLPWNTTMSGVEVHLYEQMGIVYNIKNFGAGLRLNARADASEYMEFFLKYSIPVNKHKFEN